MLMYIAHINEKDNNIKKVKIEWKNENARKRNQIENRLDLIFSLKQYLRLINLLVILKKKLLHY